MNTLDKSVLATIVYYDIFDFPMTLQEVFNFLINPQRIDPKESYQLVNLEDVLKSLNFLLKSGLVESWEGFYFLKSRKIVQARLEKNKIAEEKWRKVRKYFFWLQSLPYIEAVFASGSLALGHTSDESDLDVLVVVKHSHIWFARLLLTLATSFLGIRRSRYETVAPNKICLNHYITTDSLRIPFESMYNAQTYAHLVPIHFRSEKTVEEFYKQNQWLLKFIYQWQEMSFFQFRKAKRSRFLLAIAGLSEKFFNFTGLAKVFEKISRKIQFSRINTQLPGRVTINDRQLEFHPYSIEKTILEKYNKTIANMGFWGSYRELDSGLK